MQALVRMDSLAENLSQLQQKKARSQPFLRILVSGLCSNPKTSANSNLLTKLIQQTDIGKAFQICFVQAGCKNKDLFDSVACRHFEKSLAG